MYKLFLSLRYLRKRLIALFAVASVMLCVFMVLVVMSVMGGFLEMVKERSRGLLSDIVIDNASLQGFPYYQEFVEALRAEMPETIATATPIIYNYGILRVQSTKFTKPVRIVGIHLNEYQQVNDFSNSLWYDRFYPGTTSLDPQLVPVAGVDERGNRLLPEPYESAHQKWRGQASPDELAEYDDAPYSRMPGLRVFEQTLGPPGYLGSFDEERQDLHGIIVGCDVINERTKTGSYTRHYPVGSEILLTTLPMTSEGTISGEGSTTLSLRYADDSRTRVYEIDEICVYVDFDMVQQVLGMNPQELIDGTFTPARASQVLIRLADGSDALNVRARIEASWERFRKSLNLDPLTMDAQLMSFVTVETWQERQVQFISAVEKEKVLVVTLFGVVSLVAIVLIGCIFYMVVEKKTRDIGIIKSLGASSSGVATIFLMYGAAVGVVGSALGATLGAVFVHYINEIQDMLAAWNPDLQVWSPDVYTFDRIPNTVDPTETVIIVVVAILASMLGALIPALLAARVWPVDALRYE
ncbi:MAG: ABC transporter permease [bacterium]|nr:ABC transporter permease [bacterium]